MGIPTRVTVNYREEDGWHIFTSEDVPNLFVAHEGREIAFNDVAAVLEQIFLLQDRIICKFSPELTADQFFGQIDQFTVVLKKAA